MYIKPMTDTDLISGLYEINDDPKRKEFLDDLFSFMQKRGSPINRLPIMAKSVLDLYELYNLVIARGGLVDVINKKLWQEIIKGLHLPSSITSAAFTLRTQYMKYLYPYECEKRNLSTPAELQSAIDGNRREGRRSSYGQYEAMHNQLQLPQMARQSLPAGMQQMSPLALVTHAAVANSQQAHQRMVGGPPFGQVPNFTQDFEQRMMDYLKVHAAQAALNGSNAGCNNNLGSGNIGSSGNLLSLPHQQQRQCSQSPEAREAALNAFSMSRVALWQIYNNSNNNNNNGNSSASMNASPHDSSVRVGCAGDSQREALNLTDLPHGLTAIKRERDRDSSPQPEQSDPHDEDFHNQPPLAKRLSHHSAPTFPTSFYLPHGMAAAAAAAAVNYRHSVTNLREHDSDIEREEEDEDMGRDDDADGGEHNTTNSSSLPDDNQQLNGDHKRLLHSHNQSHHLHQHHGSSSSSGVGGNHDKSDDSAIENSPTTSGSANNGHMSPVSTKKIHLSKPQNNCGDTIKSKTNALNAATAKATSDSLENFSLLAGMQFRIARNGITANGEQQLVVNLELNGIKYTGSLTANASSTESLTTPNHRSEANELMDTEVQSTENGANDEKECERERECDRECERQLEPKIERNLNETPTKPKSNAGAGANVATSPHPSSSTNGPSKDTLLTTT